MKIHSLWKICYVSMKLINIDHVDINLLYKKCYHNHEIDPWRGKLYIIHPKKLKITRGMKIGLNKL